MNGKASTTNRSFVMSIKNLILSLFILFLSLPSIVCGEDSRQTVSGDSDLRDELGQESSVGSTDNPYLSDGVLLENVENSKAVGADFIFDHGGKVISTEEESVRTRYQDTGYTAPGTFDGQENYLEIDKTRIAKDLIKNSSGGINLSFYKNSFDYQSTNNIINRTIGEGSKSIKGGALLLRHDSYFLRSEFLNAHWSLGGGVGYNSGKGIFIDGNRSDATFNLWEIPLDLGVGLELPFSRWFKISATGGPSVLTLMQNRSDFGKGEKGKRKYQFSPGYFTNAQFKINLSNFNDNTAYEMFTTSEISNLSLNFEIRYEVYEKFKDPIKVSGASVGIGFTFEYL